MTKPWPLHPRPKRAECLDAYLLRLAQAYGVHWETMRRQVRRGDPGSLGRLGRMPAQAVLERLAANTRVPLAQLEEMALRQVQPRTMEQIEHLVAQPAIREAMLRACGGTPLEREPCHEVEVNGLTGAVK